MQHFVFFLFKRSFVEWISTVEFDWNWQGERRSFIVQKVCSKLLLRAPIPWIDDGDDDNDEVDNDDAVIKFIHIILDSGSWAE